MYMYMKCHIHVIFLNLMDILAFIHLETEKQFWQEQTILIRTPQNRCLYVIERLRIASS